MNSPKPWGSSSRARWAEVLAESAWEVGTPQRLSCRRRPLRRLSRRNVEGSKRTSVQILTLHFIA